MVTTPSPLPLLNQIWDSPPLCWSVEPTLGHLKYDKVVHRYTRWIGRLSHQASNLSCPCNLLLKGCDLCFTRYQVQGDVGSDLPSCPFIVSSQSSMRDHCDVISWHHNHLLWSSSGKTTVHAHRKCCSSSAHLPASTPVSNYYEDIWTSSSFP